MVGETTRTTDRDGGDEWHDSYCAIATCLRLTLLTTHGRAYSVETGSVASVSRTSLVLRAANKTS